MTHTIYLAKMGRTMHMASKDNRLMIGMQYDPTMRQLINTISVANDKRVFEDQLYSKENIKVWDD